MYGRDDVELALYALEEGMGAREAAELVGCGVTAVREWADCQAKCNISR